MTEEATRTFISQYVYAMTRIQLALESYRAGVTDAETAVDRVDAHVRLLEQQRLAANVYGDLKCRVARRNPDGHLGSVEA